MTINKNRPFMESQDKNQKTNQENVYSLFRLPKCEIFWRDSLLKCEALPTTSSYTKKKDETTDISG